MHHGILFDRCLFKSELLVFAVCVKRNERQDHEHFPLQEIRTKQCFHLCEDENGYRNVTKLK